MNLRAYTYIDRGHAIVGNRWMERRWSAFLGNTTALTQKDGEFEWLDGHCAEFRVVLEDEELEVIDFGETSWSEENSPRGATLVSVQRRWGLELELRTTALHDHPAQIRFFTVRNAGMEPVRVTLVCPERLPLRRDGVEVFTDDFSQGAPGAEWDAPDRQAAALVHEDRGLFFGRQGGGHMRLFAAGERECVIPVPGPGLLGRGETWRTAPTYLIPFTGGLRDAAMTTYAQFLTRYFTRATEEN